MNVPIFPLDASTSENGPLRVVPGSHLAGVLNDQGIHDCVKSHAITSCLGEASWQCVPCCFIVLLKPRPMLHDASFTLNTRTRSTLSLAFDLR